MKNVGVTGSRNGLTAVQLDLVRNNLVGVFEPGAVLHHGCCKGSDETVHWIARDLGYRIGFHPPALSTHEGRSLLNDVRDGDVLFPRKQYLERDRDIVDVVEHLFAMPETRTERTRSGTWYTYRYALRAGVPASLFLPS